ncbi:MAG: hypothetical protein L3J23_09370 [Flavobacteriaceae bacterium]|nr:hypothetical protein [Flavobacteriaceae bacterium]
MYKKVINCDKAILICNKSQYCEASFIDKLRLSFHNFLCKKCKLYSKQNLFMTTLFKIHLCKTDFKLCAEDKEVLKKNLDKELKNY